jgi:hypothetical protein
VTSAPVSFNRIERILAFMIAASGGLSLLAILVFFIARFGGKTDFGDGLWPTIGVLPLVGLPIAFLFIVVLLVVSVVRRRRIPRDGGR